MALSDYKGLLELDNAKYQSSGPFDFEEKKLDFLTQVNAKFMFSLARPISDPEKMVLTNFVKAHRIMSHTKYKVYRLVLLQQNVLFSDFQLYSSASTFSNILNKTNQVLFCLRTSRIQIIYTDYTQFRY